MQLFIFALLAAAICTAVTFHSIPRFPLSWGTGTLVFLAFFVLFYGPLPKKRRRKSSDASVGAESLALLKEEIDDANKKIKGLWNDLKREDDPEERKALREALKNDNRPACCLCDEVILSPRAIGGFTVKGNDIGARAVYCHKCASQITPADINSDLYFIRCAYGRAIKTIKGRARSRDR